MEGWLAAPALRGALRVVHNTVVQPAPTSNEYDGIAEWWFASSGADRAAFAGRDIRAQLPQAYAAIADVAGTVFMFRHVTHSRP